jgi:hypothetical protein
MVVALFVCGFLFSAAQVIWGTLLQRRVPPALLGRVSSLDFFVSLALMPISMAIAGPIGDAIGLTTVFLVAGLVPTVLAVGTLLIARLHSDELAHPLGSDGDLGGDVGLGGDDDLGGDGAPMAGEDGAAAETRLAADDRPT